MMTKSDCRNCPKYIKDKFYCEYYMDFIYDIKECGASQNDK